jgi:hypothetical protein
MQEDDVQALRAAVAALEHPVLAARLAEIAGSRSSWLVGRCLRRRPGQLPQQRPRRSTRRFQWRFGP